MANHYDVVVIGAGAAGLTAAIYLARARVSTLVVDEGIPGGQMVLSHQVANYPGVPEASGAELSRTMLRQARSFGAEVVTQSRVESMDLTTNPKVIAIEDEGTVTADAVILATGGVPRHLGIPSEQEFAGRGISYCATCDGDFFSGREIVAIGGGNSAVEEAVALAQYASKVTIVHEFEEFQAQPYLVEEARKNPKIEFLMNQRVLEFQGGDELSSVITEDKTSGEREEIPAAGCFVFIGYVPKTDDLRGVLELSDRAEIVTDESMATSVPGVYAAGDCRQKRFRQITTSVADGTIAALSAIEYLREHRTAGVPSSATALPGTSTSAVA